jgi:WD40 repeat protein
VHGEKWRVDVKSTIEQHKKLDYTFRRLFFSWDNTHELRVNRTLKNSTTSDLLQIQGIHRMKNKTPSLPITILWVISLVFLLAACQTAKENNQVTQALPSSTQTPTKPFPTKTPIPRIITPTKNHKYIVIPTNTNTPTKAPEIASKESIIAYIGTPISSSFEAIGINNYQNLTKVGEWGKGNLLGVAYAPDGKTFLVGSAFGYTIYSTEDFESPPRWVPFDSPAFYDEIVFSKDSQYLMFIDKYKDEESNSEIIRNYFTGEKIKATANIDWQERISTSQDWGAITVNSPDGLKQFKSRSSAVTFKEKGVSWEDENEIIPKTGIYDSKTDQFLYSIPGDSFDNEMIYEISKREMYDAKTDELLYTLPDQTFYYKPLENITPEGCDLDTWTPCGNAYEPSAYHPYQVSFSPSGDSFTILYRAPNLIYDDRFGILRIYQESDGKLLKVFGSIDNAVLSYAYSPDGNRILIGFVDGNIKLWDIENNTDIYNGTHFNDTIGDIAYSLDGKYVIIQRPNVVEIRLASDGSLRSSLSASAYALSPLGNLMALGEVDGTLRLIDIDTGKTHLNIQAHSDEIFALTFTPDGQTITSSGQDCSVQSWDINTGKRSHSFEQNSTNAYQVEGLDSRIFIYYMRYIPGLNQLLGYGSWSRVVSWDANSGKTQYFIEPEALDFYQGMMTVKDHFPETFAIDFPSQRFFVDSLGYNIKTGEVIGEYQAPQDIPEGCYINGATSNDGKLIFSKGYDQYLGEICVRKSESNKLIARLDIIPEDLSDYLAIDWLYLSPEGNQLLVSTTSDVIYVYQITPGD